MPPRAIVPAAVLPGGQGARIQAYAPSGAAFDELGKRYRIETPAYCISAEGHNDSIGRAAFRLPASGQGSRILLLPGSRPVT